MNNRERAMRILHYQDVDRLPAVHFGYWKELLLEWAAQGKIPHELADPRPAVGSAAERELERLIGWDFGWSPIASVSDGLYPQFERVVLEEYPDGRKKVQNQEGLIEITRDNNQSIASECDYLLKDREAFETLYRPKMQYTPERIDFDYFKNFNQTREYDRPAGLFVGSVIGHIRNMASLTGLSYLMYDEDEDLLCDIVDTFADMQYQCVEAVLQTGAKFDYALYWEDMCGADGPLISPAKYEELCAKHYKRRNDLLLQYGIDIVSLDCDGITEKLQPIWLENGVNTLFPIEHGVWGDQFGPARARHGKAMRGVGGMNKIALREDKSAVDKEIERIKRLVADGGYIPCPDHRLMPGTKFELVQYYAEEIKKIKL